MTNKFFLGLFLILLAACNSGGGGSSSSGGGGSNPPPVVTPGDTHTEETKSYSLQASQSIGVALVNEGFTASIATAASKGSLTGTYPNYTYTSLGGASGTDTVILNLSKSGATKKMTLKFYINSIPYAANFSVTVLRGNVIDITLEGDDDDGDDLTYSLIQSPDTGSILWTAGSSLVKYEASNSPGSTSLFYQVSDGKALSSIAKVTIIIAASVPTITSGATLTTTEDLAKSFTVTATDSTTLTYSISANPTHGAISGTNGSYSYLPALNYAGTDSFKVRATNTAGAFAEKNISVTISPVNDNPVFNDIGMTIEENSEAFVIMAASDVDSTSLTYTILTQPTLGTAWTINDRLFYSPNLNTSGTDTFNMRVCDNGAPIMCDTAVVTIAIVNQISEPIAYDQESAVAAGESVSITLTGTYENISGVTVNILTQPTKGTLVSNGGMNFTYTPSASDSGESSAIDYFSFVFIEGNMTSNQAVVTLNINYPFNYLQFNIEGGFKKMSLLEGIFHQDEVGSSHYYLSTKDVEIDEDNTLKQAFVSLDKDELICPSMGVQYLMIPLYFDPSSKGEVFTTSSDYACSDLKSTFGDDSFYATQDLIVRESIDSAEGVTKTMFGLNKLSADNNTTLASLNALILNNFELVSIDLANKAPSFMEISSFSARLMNTTIMGEGATQHLFIKSNEIVKNYTNTSMVLDVYHEVVMLGSEMQLKDKYYLVNGQMRRLQLLINEWYLMANGEVSMEEEDIIVDAGRILILGDVIVLRQEQKVESFEYLDEDSGQMEFEYKVLQNPSLEIYNRKP